MGYREMICTFISESLNENEILQLVDKSILEARINREPHINIIFITNSVGKAFKYRDIFTKYIDIGIRLYIIKELTEFKDIIQKCKYIFISSNDKYLNFIVNKYNDTKVNVV